MRRPNIRLQPTAADAILSRPRLSAERQAASTAEAHMVMNRSAPTATIVPVLIYEDVGQAIDWLCRAFGTVPASCNRRTTCH